MADLRALMMEHQAVVQRIREMYPEEDDAVLADTIEGASDLPEALILTLRAAVEAEALADGLNGLIMRMQERKGRLMLRSYNLRAAALQAALDTGLAKLTAPDFSATVAKGRPKVIITNEKEVPDSFCRLIREPIKKAISDAMVAGLKPTWAEWSNPSPHWTVRTK